MAAFGWLAFDGTFTRKEHRQGVGSLLGGKPSGRPLGATSGITSPVVLSVTSTTWTVGSFTAITDLESDATMGPTPCVSDGNQTGSVNAASGAYDRYDLLYLTLDDATALVPTIEYTPGTSATTLPAVPSEGMAFAQITVPKSGTGSPTITLIAPRAYAAGAIAAVTGSSQYPATPYVGQYIDDATLGLLRWNGSAWVSGLYPVDVQLKVTTGGQSLPLTTETSVNSGWVSEAWCSTAAGISVPAGSYTIQTAGDYDISGGMGVSLSGSDRIDANIKASSTLINQGSATITTAGTVPVAARRVTLGVGAVVSMYCFHGSGSGAATVTTGTWLRVKRVF